MATDGLIERLVEALPIRGHARTALIAFATQAVNHREVEGILLYGSSLWKTDPADLDFVILLAKSEYVHFYGVNHALGLRCEIDYITSLVLEDYVKYPHWRATDWELEIGAKYVHGQILSDKQGQLAQFRQRMTGPESLGLRRYLFVHQLGQATSRLEKLATRKADYSEPDVFQLTADFAHAFDSAAHHALLTYPRNAHTLDGWPLTPQQHAGLIAPGHIELKSGLLDKVAAQGINNLGLGKLFEDCPNIEAVLEKLPIYHLVDYTGLERILKTVRPDLHLPTDLMMPLFNAYYSPVTFIPNGGSAE